MKTNRRFTTMKFLAPLAAALLLSACGGGAYVNTVHVTRYAGVDENSKASLGKGQTNRVTGQPSVYKLLGHTDANKRYVVMAGGPEDKGGGEVIDLWARDVKASGSALGFRINQAMKITVASPSFVPRVVVLENLTQWPNSDKPEFYLAVDSKTPASTAGGVNVNSVSYRLQDKSQRDGTNITGVAVGVLSADGKTGDYTIKIVSEN
jgi:hypothetical protein